MISEQQKIYEQDLIDEHRLLSKMHAAQLLTPELYNHYMLIDDYVFGILTGNKISNLPAYKKGSKPVKSVIKKW